MKVDLIPFWFPLVNGDLRGFNFFLICIKKMYSVQILRWIIHVFTIENFYEKHVSLYLYLYTYRFSFCFQNYIMEHYCEMNKSGFKVPELHPLPKGVSPGKLWEIYI